MLPRHSLWLLLGLQLACGEAPVAVATRHNQLRRPVMLGATANNSQRYSTVAVFPPNSVCTGTLVGTRAVVTAQHCVLDDNGQVQLPTAFSFVVGALNVSTAFGSERYPVTQVFAHPGYVSDFIGNDPDGLQISNDIAVLLLSRDVTQLPPAPILPMAEVDQAIPYHHPLIISGYGLSSAGGNDTGVLRIATTPYERRS